MLTYWTEIDFLISSLVTPLQNMSEHERQVSQMMAFLMAEAQEKADEIRQKANAEYETQYQEAKRKVE